MMQISEAAVYDALREIRDPDLHKDIGTLGFVQDMNIGEGGAVSFRLVLTTPACPVKDAFQAQAEELKAARVEVAKLMHEHGLTLEDLISKEAKPTRKHAPSTRLYKDPVSGKTWTGRGRAPDWLEGKNKDEFLVQK